MDGAVARYLRTLVDEASAVLGRQLLGAYATGSVAFDAFQPGVSDVDTALVCHSPLADATKAQLVQRLRHESLECPARGLELVVYRREVASSGSVAPGFELELNTGAGMPFRATWRPEERPEADGLFWYALDRSILRQSGLALLGPPAGDVFADLADTDLRDLLITSLRWWIADAASSGDGAEAVAPGAEEAVLGACRALVKCRSGRWLGKADAARRLLEEGFQPADVVEQSIDARSGGPSPDARRARAFQRQVLDEISSAPRGAATR